MFHVKQSHYLEMFHVKQINKGGEKMKREKFQEIWLRRPKELVISEIARLKSDYVSAKLSYKYYVSKSDKDRYSRYKAFYFAAILIRKRLLRKKRLYEKEAEKILEIIFKKYPFLSHKYLQNVFTINWYSLKALEENFSRGANI